MQTVLVVGATGNVGVSVITAALRSKKQVLAIVRNQDSAEKLFKHVGSKEGITTVEADVTSGRGVQAVVDQVKAGKLPPFQHVYSTVGTWTPTPLKELTTDGFRKAMNVCVEANFFAYRATMPYLIEQRNPESTWTLVTGAADKGFGGVTAMTQGAIISMIKAINNEDARHGIRINEVYLSCRVEYDAVAKKSGVMPSSEFGRVYEAILARPEIKSSRVVVRGQADVEKIKYEPL